MAVLAPIPSASVTTVSSGEPGAGGQLAQRVADVLEQRFHVWA